MPRTIAAILRLFTLVFLAIPSMLLAQGSPNVQLAGQFNSYATDFYNDCWGYTAPNGREYALLGVRTGTSIIDITDAPTLVESAFIPSPTSTWKDIKTYRQYAYVVTEASGGLQVIDLSQLPDTATLVNTVPDLTPSHNISIDTARALLYVEGGLPPVPVRVYSLSNPANPTPVSTFGIETHDIFAQNGRAYISEGNQHSIGIYTLQDPATPDLFKRFQIPNAGYVHNAWATEDDSYLMTTEEQTDKSVKMWDIRDTSAITMTDEFVITGAIAHNVHIKNGYAYLSYYTEGLRILDISDPSNITEAGYYDTYPGPSGGFSGAWGAYPFLASGKVLISDIQSGLYVVTFAGAITSVPVSQNIDPQSFILHQNYPNPFNPTTSIAFEIPKQSHVRLTVYNILGAEVARLVDESRSPGVYSEQFDATGLTSGAYFVRLEAGGFSTTQRMILLR